jgi:hypothetical protein
MAKKIMALTIAADKRSFKLRQSASYPSFAHAQRDAIAGMRRIENRGERRLT